MKHLLSPVVLVATALLSAAVASAQVVAPNYVELRSRTPAQTATPPSGRYRIIIDAGTPKIENPDGSTTTIPTGASGIGGTMTTGTVPVATAATTVGDSYLVQGTNLIELKNAANSTKLRVYKNATDYASIFHNSTDSFFGVNESTPYGMGIRQSDGLLGFYINGTVRWAISAAVPGLLFPAADNTYDFGLASNRIRTIYSGGGWQTGVAAKTGAYTLTVNDSVILVDASGGAVTITLPAAATGLIGQTWRVKKTDSSGNAVTIQRNAAPGTDTVDGGASTTLTTQYQAKDIIATTATTFGVF